MAEIKREPITGEDGRATLRDHKGRTWVEDPSTADKAVMPVWWLEDLLRLHYEEIGWILTLPGGVEHKSGKQSIHEAIMNLEHTIKTALSGRAPQDGKGGVLTQDITDRDGRVWTLQPGERAFWFTGLVGGGEARLVRGPGALYFDLGFTGGPRKDQVMTTGAQTLHGAINIAADLLKDEPVPGVPAQEAEDRILDEDGMVWVWQTNVEAGGDPAWVSADGWIFWHEKKQRWFLRTIQDAALRLDHDIDLHETSIRPAIKAATKYLNRKPKEAPVPHRDHTSEPYTDSAGRTWTFDVGQDEWHTDVMFTGYAHLGATTIRLVRTNPTWTLEGLDPDPVNTGKALVVDAIEAVRERIDVATLTPETAEPYIKDWAKQIDQEAKRMAAQSDPVRDLLKGLGLPVADAPEYPTGAWLVMDGQSGDVAVYLEEIDALRAVNGVDAKAFFVPDGQTLSSVRGW